MAEKFKKGDTAYGFEGCIPMTVIAVEKLRPGSDLQIVTVQLPEGKYSFLSVLLRHRPHPKCAWKHVT